MMREKTFSLSMVKQNKMVSYDTDKARPLLSVFEQALLITGYILM